MKKLMIMFLAALGVCFMAGCGDTIDGTSEESFQRSSARMALNLDDDELIEFVAAATLIDSKEKEPRKVVDGMTAAEVVDKARELDAAAFEAKLETFAKFPESTRKTMIERIRRQAEETAEGGEDKMADAESEAE
ncbi:MAG: hypothetical protein AB7F40_07480 [Victivallaceae bacterium]|nr:hypothetical protein [Victivallaceae bacterium]